MKSLIFLFCCLGVLAELRATHVVGLPESGPHFSHLPDESNFQASGGAALGSFGGFTRVVVLLVVLLGVLYHGFVPTGVFGPEASVRRSVTRLPIRKVSETGEEHSQIASFTSITQAKVAEVASELRVETSRKASKQLTKKQAKKAAKKLLENLKAEEEKKTHDVIVENKVVINKEQSTVNQNTVAEAKEIVVANVAEERIVTDNEKAIVDNEKENNVVENFGVVDFSLQEDSKTQTHEKEEEVVTIVERKADKEPEIVMALEPNEVPTEVHSEKVYFNEEERQQEEVVTSGNKNGWVSNPYRVYEKTSATIKRARRMLNVADSHSVKQVSEKDETDPWGSGLDDLDFDSFVADPRAEIFPTYGAPLFVEDSSLLDIDGLESPASIEPVRDKIFAPFMVPEFVPMNKALDSVPILGSGSAPKVTYESREGSRDWAFNSHKKTAWMQKQSRTNWPTDPLAMPSVMSFGVPWSPIRTPCKFGSGCKKPGCQFTHPTTVLPPALRTAF